MRLGILSDTHNDRNNITTALSLFESLGVDQIFHCGDISSPDTLWLFAGWQASFVFGNMDHDRVGLIKTGHEFGFLQMGESWSGQVDGMNIACCHGHDLGVSEPILKSGLYDYLFMGHTHRRFLKKRGRTRIVNPGALGGRQPQSRSVAVLYTLQDSVRFYNISDGSELVTLD